MAEPEVPLSDVATLLHSTKPEGLKAAGKRWTANRCDRLQSRWDTKFRVTMSRAVQRQDTKSRIQAAQRQKHTASGTGTSSTTTATTTTAVVESDSESDSEVTPPLCSALDGHLGWLLFLSMRRQAREIVRRQRRLVVPLETTARGYGVPIPRKRPVV